MDISTEAIYPDDASSEAVDTVALSTKKSLNKPCLHNISVAHDPDLGPLSLDILCSYIGYASQLHKLGLPLHAIKMIDCVQQELLIEIC